MGILGSILGTDSQGSTADADPASESEQKYAILLNAGPENAPSAANAFNYAIEFDDGGHEVQLYLDGTAAKWPAEFVENPDRPFSHDWERIQRRGLLAGACGYCANAFDAVEACQRADVPLLDDGETHAPAVAELADQNYEILTVG